MLVQREIIDFPPCFQGRVVCSLGSRNPRWRGHITLGGELGGGSFLPSPKNHPDWIFCSPQDGHETLCFAHSSTHSEKGGSTPNQTKSAKRVCRWNSLGSGVDMEGSMTDGHAGNHPPCSPSPAPSGNLACGGQLCKARMEGTGRAGLGFTYPYHIFLFFIFSYINVGFDIFIYFYKFIFHAFIHKYCFLYICIYLFIYSLTMYFLFYIFFTYYGFLGKHYTQIVWISQRDF